MDSISLLPPLDVSEIQERVKALEFHPDLIAVTLLDGAIIMGGLMPIDISDRDDVVLIRYNSPEGQRFGTSRIAEIPFTFIADFIPIPLAEESLPKIQSDPDVIELFKSIGVESLLPSSVAVWDYPNPLAKIIYDHNLQVVINHSLDFFEYNEKALSDQVIPGKGIKFNKPILLYSDYDFFTHTMKGGVEVTGGVPGLIEISKGVSSSLLDRAFQKLQNSFLNRASKAEYLNEHWMHGCILTPQEPQNTEIQEEKCIVIFCASTSKSSGGQVFPVLIKLRYLNYPQEFLRHIVSPLTFYGELVPIPVMGLDRVHSEILMARAIGYLHD